MAKDNLQEKSNALSKLKVWVFLICIKKAKNYQMDLSTGKV